jgi:hypothetical protein
MSENKLRLFDEHPSWEKAEQTWEDKAKVAKEQKPLKMLKRLPKMPGITKGAARFLKLKSLKWMLAHDTSGKIRSHFLKKPLTYTYKIITSLFQKKQYARDDDFFLYGVKNLKEFQSLLSNDNNLFVLGFSYCHKPLECPSGRFTDECVHDLKNPICQQCFIGKSVHALPQKNTYPLFIPTVHYISEQILEIQEKNPGKTLLFLITACEMTLEMFGLFGNMANIKGVGVRLDGRICNTMRAFELSEQGIKPGLTVVLDRTQERMLELIRLRRNNTSDNPS